MVGRGSESGNVALYCCILLVFYITSPTLMMHGQTQIKFTVNNVWQWTKKNTRLNSAIYTNLSMKTNENIINCTHFMTRVRSYSSCCTQLWNSTFSRRIHSSVITGIISWRPTTSFPCLHKSFTPSSTSGMPATLWNNLRSTGRNKWLLGR